MTQDRGPSVSVVMPAYNETVPMISEAIDSILGQTYTDFEFVIVLDNAENPEMESVVRGYADADSRIKVLKNEKNLGISESLNRGIAASSGDYIARMDADDVAFPDRIEKQLKYVMETGASLVASDVVTIDGQGAPIDMGKVLRRGSYELGDVLRHTNAVTHPTVMMSRDALNGLGGYRRMIASEDYDLWLRFLSGGHPMRVVSEPLLYYRHREGSLTKNHMCSYIGGKYCRRLFRERLERGGQDSFSETDSEAFYRKMRYFDLRYRERFNRGYEILDESMILFKHGKIAAGTAGLLGAVAKSGAMGRVFLERLAMAIAKRQIFKKSRLRDGLFGEG
ncbi:MAG: glycosyltransferase [Clostridiales Family XIII bacterium]|jgi:glycosyltransferase involved in cell wall biosynthesis|nr:glycosyltransferase [Clostridiales Family XIII bacterium]